MDPPETAASPLKQSRFSPFYQMVLPKNTPDSLLHATKLRSREQVILRDPRRTKKIVWFAAILCTLFTLLIIFFGIAILIVFAAIQPKVWKAIKVVLHKIFSSRRRAISTGDGPKLQSNITAYDQLHQKLVEEETHAQVHVVVIPIPSEAGDDDEEAAEVVQKPVTRVDDDLVSEMIVCVSEVVDEVRWITHYSSQHRILLVGEGDFSFAVCLATAFGMAPNIIATSLDSQEFQLQNYVMAASNLEELSRRLCTVMHGVDATTMAKNASLRRLTFDRIVYNFPYAGLWKNLSRQEQLLRHRELVHLFFKNARKMIAEMGEIHVTHKTNAFHEEWDLESIASCQGLKLFEAVEFYQWQYPGYQTKYGFGGDRNFNWSPSKTYKFVVKEDSLSIVGGTEMIKTAAANDQSREEVEVSMKKKMVAVDTLGRKIKHYCSLHRILLVGEGDFSFAASLAVAFRRAPNMIATSLDSQEFLSENYARAASYIAELKRRQCSVYHEIDATKLTSYSCFINFDRIVWNFPYAGFFRNLPRDAQLRRHRRVVSLFLKNAKEMIAENGEIHVTHMTKGSFYGEWNLESIASSHGLKLIEAVKFSKRDYPGYCTKYGFGGDKDFECNPSKTFKFGIK